jgi:hypothetical protein
MNNPMVSLHVNNNALAAMNKYKNEGNYKDLYVISALVLGQSRMTNLHLTQDTINQAKQNIKYMEDRKITIDSAVESIKDNIELEQLSSKCGVGKPPNSDGTCNIGWYMEKAGNKACCQKVSSFMDNQESHINSLRNKLKEQNIERQLMDEYDKRFGVQDRKNPTSDANKYYKIRTGTKEHATSPRLIQLALDKKEKNGDDEFTINKTKEAITLYLNQTEDKFENGEEIGPWNIYGMSKMLFNSIISSFNNVKDAIDHLLVTDYTSWWLIVLFFKLIIVYMCLMKCKNVTWSGAMMKAAFAMFSMTFGGLSDVAKMLFASASLAASTGVVVSMVSFLLPMFNLAFLSIRITRMFAFFAAVADYLIIVYDIFNGLVNFYKTGEFTVCNMAIKSFLSSFVILGVKTGVVSWIPESVKMGTKWLSDMSSNITENVKGWFSEETSDSFINFMSFGSQNYEYLDKDGYGPSVDTYSGYNKEKNDENISTYANKDFCSSFGVL